MNYLEGQTSKFNSSSSDMSKQKMWNYENMAGMIGDIVGQVKEQQWIGTKLMGINGTKGWIKNPKALQEEVDVLKSEYDAIIKGTSITNKSATLKALSTKQDELAKAYEVLNESKSKIAKSVTLGYLTLTSMKDVYGEAKLAGYDDRTAGLVSMVASGALYAVDSKLDIGSWMIPDASKTAQRDLKNAVKQFIKEDGAAIQESLDKIATGVATSKTKQNLIKSTSKLKQLSERA